MSLTNQFSDIPYGQKSDMQDYINAFDIDNNTIDFETLSDYEESNNTLNAYHFNNIKSNINNMQDNWCNNVNNVLDDKAETFQSWINNLGNNVSIWQSGSSNLYYKNDIVTYSEDIGAIFLCLQDCNGSQLLPTASSVVNDYWLRIYIKGDAGQDTYNLNYIGEFDWEWESFVVNDIVYLKGQSIDFYVCISNITYTRETDISTDTIHWVKLFSVPLDYFEIYDEMPSQEFFNNPNSSSVFGVVQKNQFINDNIINTYIDDCVADLDLSINKKLWFDIYPDANSNTKISMSATPTIGNFETFYMSTSDSVWTIVDLSNTNLISDGTLNIKCRNSDTQDTNVLTLTYGQEYIVSFNNKIETMYDGAITLKFHNYTGYEGTTYISVPQNNVGNIDLTIPGYFVGLNVGIALRFYDNKIYLVYHSNTANIWIYNKIQYERFICPDSNNLYLKIVFNEYTDIPILIKVIDRVHSTDISNPKYLKIISNNGIVYNKNNTLYHFTNYLDTWLINNNFVN